MEILDHDFGSEFAEAKQAGDFLKLEFLLRIKEKRCEFLKNRLQEEKKKEDKIRKQKIKEFKLRFKKLQKTESKLTRSLITSASRTSTPRNSPKASPEGNGKKSDKKRKVVSTKKKTLTPKTKSPGRKKTQDQSMSKGEFEFANLFALGKNDKFHELFNQAMAVSAKKGGSTFSNPTSMGIVNGDNEVNRDVKKFENPTSTGVNASNRLVSNNNSVNHTSPDNNVNLIDVSSPEGQKRLVELLEQMQSARNNKTTDNSVKNKDKVKKLASGRVTKPDESDIKKQVKFAHVHLDPKHVKEKIFDKLSFPTLIAGELELASLPGIPPEERDARIAIAKTMCYHKLYLNDDDLKSGYDAILKTIEQGATHWSPSPCAGVKAHYEFQANVVWRERLAENKKSGSANGTSTSSNDNSKPDSKSEDSEDSENKIIYCMEFNKGNCSQSKSHQGKWKGKTVTK